MFRFPGGGFDEPDFSFDDLGDGGGTVIDGPGDDRPTGPPASAAAGESFAQLYESGSTFGNCQNNWTSWTENYMKNHSDLVAALPSWVPGILHTYSNGYSQYFPLSSVEAAARLHYVLYGYYERRIPNCPIIIIEDTTGPAISSMSASLSQASIGQGESSTLTLSCTVTDPAGVASVTANGQAMTNTSGNTWSLTYGTYVWNEADYNSRAANGGKRTLAFIFEATDSDNNANTSTASVSTELTYEPPPAVIISTPSWTHSNIYGASVSNKRLTHLSPAQTTRVTAVLSNSQFFRGKSASLSIINNSSLASRVALSSVTIPSSASGNYTMSWNVTLGTSSHVSLMPNYGNIISFGFRVSLAGGSSDLTGCSIINNHDETAPIVQNETWTDGSTFAFNASAGSSTTVDKYLYWEAGDPQSGISLPVGFSNIGTMELSTSIALGGGMRRYIYRLRINGDQATSAGNGGEVRASFYAYNAFQNASGGGQGLEYGTTLTGSISILDTTKPVITILSNGTKTASLSTSDGTHNNTTSYSIGFTVADTHSSISSVSVNQISSGTNTVGTLSNIGNNYSQSISVPASHIGYGGSLSHTYRISVTDSAGNTQTKDANLTITRTDNSPPTASVSGNTDTITFESASTTTSAYKVVSVTWSDHSAIDTTSINVQRLAGHGYWSHGSWSGNIYSGRWNVNRDNYSHESTTGEVIRFQVRDSHDILGTSGNFAFSVFHDDNSKPTISNVSASDITFYASSGHTSSSTLNGTITWKVGDSHSGISSVSASKIGSNTHISSVGIASETTTNNYSVSFTLKNSFGYSNSFTTRSNMVRLSVTDNGGNTTTEDVDIRGRYIDNENPYFLSVPDAKYHTFTTSQGSGATANMSVSVTVGDNHSGISGYDVEKVSGSSNWPAPTNVSLSGNTLSFTIPLAASVLTADNSNVEQKVLMRISDAAGRTAEQEWSGFVRRQDNQGPIITVTNDNDNGEIRELDFTTTGASHLHVPIEFTVTDAHNSVNENSFIVTTPKQNGYSTYITVSGVTSLGNNKYTYTATIPRSGKSIHPTQTSWGTTVVTVEDSEGNPSSATTKLIGAHFDRTPPSISNASFDGRFDFTTSSLSTTQITRNLTFTTSDSHSSLNAPNVTSSSGQVSIGSRSSSGNSHTFPVTLTRAGLTSNHTASVLINVSDTANNSAAEVEVPCTGSYIDNKGPSIGTETVTDSKSVTFSLASPPQTGKIIKSVSIPVSDEIELKTFSVHPLSGANCEPKNLQSISGTSDNAQFDVEFDVNDYDLENSVNESVRVIVYDHVNNSSQKDITFNIFRDDDIRPTISSNGTVFFDFYESEGTVAVISKNFDHNFTIGDIGSGTNSPYISQTTGNITVGTVSGSGNNWSVRITTSSHGFVRYDGYKNVGTFTIKVTDKGGNDRTQTVAVQSRFIDNVAPAIGTTTPSNLSLTTASSDHNRTIVVSVSDSGTINANTLTVTKTSGNGQVSNATYNSNSNTISFNVETRPSDYTADNGLNLERFSISITDDNNRTGTQTVQYYVRVEDKTAPILTVLESPEFNFSEGGHGQLTLNAKIRAIDIHTGINSTTFSIDNLIPVIEPNAPTPTLDEINEIDEIDRIDQPNNTVFTRTSGNANDGEYTFPITVNKPDNLVDDDTLFMTVSVFDNNNKGTVSVPIIINHVDDVAPVVGAVNVHGTTQQVLASAGKSVMVNAQFSVYDNGDGIVAIDGIVPSKQSNGSVAQASIVKQPTLSGTTYTIPIEVIASSLEHNETELLQYKVTARDSANNVSAEKHFQFTVKVIDDVKPTIIKTSGIANFSLNNYESNADMKLVEAQFTINDNDTPLSELRFSVAPSDWGYFRNGNTLTVSRTYFHSDLSSTINDETVTVTVRDNANLTASATDSFRITRVIADLEPPVFDILEVSSNDNSRVRLSNNNKTQKITISGRVNDTGSGINWSTLRLASLDHYTLSPGTLLAPSSYNAGLGTFEFELEWNYSNPLWNNLWSMHYNDVIFTERFVASVSDNETLVPANTETSPEAHVELLRDDVIAPILSQAVIPSSFDIDFATERVAGRSVNLDLNVTGVDNETGIEHNSWDVTLSTVHVCCDGTIQSIQSTAGSLPATLTVTPQANNVYKLRLLDIGAVENFCDYVSGTDFRITISVQDKVGNNAIIASNEFTINNIENNPPTIPVIAHRDNTTRQVSASSQTFTHRITVTTSDNQSGIDSVVISDSNYQADGNNGIDEYYFKRDYTYDQIWNNKPNTLTNLITATATDKQGNFSTSSSFRVEISAVDTARPSILSATHSANNNRIIMNTEDNTAVSNTITAVVRDNNHEPDALVVTASHNNVMIPVTLVNQSGRQRDRTYTGTISYSPNNFAGTTTQTWTINARDAANLQADSLSMDLLTIIKEDATDPVISSVKIKQAASEVLSASLRVDTNAQYNANIEVIVSDAHSNISSVTAAQINGSIPVTITNPATRVGTSNVYNIPISIAPSAVALHTSNKDATLGLRITATDAANNSDTSDKNLNLVLTDLTPPSITNITVNDVVFNHDHDGVTAPPDQIIELRANITDAGSGLKSVKAEVSYSTDIAGVSGNNVEVPPYSSLNGLYIWQFTVSPGMLAVNSAEDFVFKITAEPHIGGHTVQYKTSNVSLVDNRGPRGSAVARKTSGVLIPQASVHDINTSQGSMQINYTISSIDRSAPISLVSAKVNGSLQNGHTVTSTDSGREIVVSITHLASSILLEKNYGENHLTDVRFIVQDMHGHNSDEIIVPAFNLRVIDNSDPIVSTSAAVSPVDGHVVSQVSGAKEITITATFQDNQSGINKNHTSLLDENDNIINDSRVKSLTTTLSNNNKTALVTAVLEYAHDTTGIGFGINDFLHKLRVSDNNGNTITSNAVSYSIRKVDAIPPTITSVVVKVNGVQATGTNASITLDEGANTTGTITIEAIVGDNKAQPIPKLNDNTGVIQNATANDIVIGHGVAFGGKHTWIIPFVESDYAYGTHSRTYTISVTDEDNLSAQDQVINVDIIKQDVVKPVITITSVDAIALDSSPNTNLGDSIKSGSNNVQLGTDNSLITNQVKLKIFGEVTEHTNLKAGFPSAIGWSRFNGSGPGKYVWEKTVSGNTLGFQQINATIKAVDNANNQAEDVLQSFNVTTIDTTKPVITNFRVDGLGNGPIAPPINPPLPPVQENGNAFEESITIIGDEDDSGGNDGGSSALLISLRESERETTTDAVFTLNYTDNGTVDIADVVVEITYSTHHIETLSSGTAIVGGKLISKSFSYDDFESILPLGQLIDVVFTAKVTDSAGNLTTETIDAKIEIIDNTVPQIDVFTLKTGIVEGQYTNTVGVSGTHEFISSQKDIPLFFEAEIVASDARGIASAVITGSEGLTFQEETSGKYRASISYDDLGFYARSYSFIITATATDNSGQSTSIDKTFTLSKRDDIIPTASLVSISDVSNGKITISSEDSEDPQLTVVIDVAENTLTTMGGAKLEGEGANISITPAGMVKNGTTRRFTYIVGLDRNDYKIVDLAEDINPANRIETENLVFSITDGQGNSSGETLISSFDVEVTDDTAPDVSISYSADPSIIGASNNRINLTAGKVTASPSIYIYASFVEHETDIDISTLSINSSGFVRTYNASGSQSLPPKTATFKRTIDMDFYNSLTKYDEYEEKIYQISARDMAGNLVTANAKVFYKRSDILPPVINSFTAGGVAHKTITHLDTHSSSEDKTIEVILAADMGYEERGLYDLFVTYTKNGVEQNIRIPEDRWTGGNTFEQSFNSVKPNDGIFTTLPNDEYVFTLHAIDLNNQESTETANLTVKFEDRNPPIIHSNFFSKAGSTISQLLINTAGQPNRNGISETVQFKAALSDFADRIDQLTISLTKNNDYANAVVSNIQRVANEKDNNNRDVAVFDVTFTSVDAMTTHAKGASLALSVADRASAVYAGQGDNPNISNVTRSLNVALFDNSPPVIHSFTLTTAGSINNKIRATNNPQHKSGIILAEAIVYDESELDMSTASVVIAENDGTDGPAFVHLTTTALQSPIEGDDGISRPASRLLFSKSIHYDEERFNLGSNTVTATMNINDINGQAAVPVTGSTTVIKEDHLAPNILGLGFFKDSVMSVIDNTWPLPDFVISANNGVIDRRGNGYDEIGELDSTSYGYDHNRDWETAPIQDDEIVPPGTGGANLQSLKTQSVWITVNTTIPSSTANQTLYMVGGLSNESTMSMAIENNRFIVHVGKNAIEDPKNESVVLSWDMRNDEAGGNPLASFMGTGNVVELALLIRLDIGAVLLYAQGKLIAAGQANERNSSLTAWGGSLPTQSIGNVDTIGLLNRSVHTPSGGTWQGNILSSAIYIWTENNTAKVAAESSIVNATVSSLITSCNGSIRYAGLDNEPITNVLRLDDSSGAVQNKTILNGVTKYPVTVQYTSTDGTKTTDQVYHVTIKEVHNLNQQHDIGTITVRKINIDTEAPEIASIEVKHETAVGGEKVLGAQDIVAVSTNASESLLITINATDNGELNGTKKFDVIVGTTKLTSVQPVGESGLQLRVNLTWQQLHDIMAGTGNNNGDYNLQIVAIVKDSQDNESEEITESVTIRTVDNIAPSITGAQFHTPGLIKSGSLENDGDPLIITTTLSNADPNKTIDMTVLFTDNNKRMGASSAISITPVGGTVHTGGPGIYKPQQLAGGAGNGFSVVSSQSGNDGTYSARIRRNWNYAELTAKSSSQYSYTENNNERWSVIVRDSHGNIDQKIMVIRVLLIDDVDPAVPTITMNPSIVQLSPGESRQVTATITTSDNNGINHNDVELLTNIHTAGNNDLQSLAVTVIDSTPVNPSPSNKKVFSATFTVNYDDITGAHDSDRVFKIGATIKDLANREKTNTDAARLTIRRVDTQLPVITYVKRDIHHSPNYNTYSAVALNTADYNEVNVYDNGNSATDIRVSITDLGGINPASIKMYRSLPIEGLSTDAVLQIPNQGNNNGGAGQQDGDTIPPLDPPAINEDVPDDNNEIGDVPGDVGQSGLFIGATEVPMNTVGANLYAPATQPSFNYADYAKFHRGGDGHSYYVWIKVVAEDMAQNKAELHFPFKINKVDDEIPSLIVTTKAQQLNNGAVVSEDANGFILHTHTHPVTAIVQTGSTHARVQVRIIASDNDEIEAVGTAENGSVIDVPAVGPVTINNTSMYTLERTYVFNDGDDLGQHQVDSFNILAIDKTGRVRAHRVLIVLDRQDITAPGMIVTMTTEGQLYTTETGLAELRYPGNEMILVARAEITDQYGVDVDSINISSAQGWSARTVVDGKYEWRKTVAHETPFGIKTESITVSAQDNSGNLKQENASIQYVVSQNIGLSLVSSTLHVESDTESGIYNQITNPIHNVDPARTYNVRFQWVIADGSNLNASGVDENILNISAPTNSLTVTSVSKTGVSGHQTYTVDAVIDTANLNKGQNNSLSITLTATDIYNQSKSHNNNLVLYVFDFVTIDQQTDYYIMFDANVNTIVTPIKDENGAIISYMSHAKPAASFENVQPVQVNYPTGSVNIEIEPFFINKIAAGSEDTIERQERFRVFSQISAESDGAVDATVALEDRTVSLSYIDDHTAAQIIYSNMDTHDPDYVPPVSHLDADKLARTYTSTSLMSNPIIAGVVSNRAALLLESGPPAVGIINILETPQNGVLDQLAIRNGTFGNRDIILPGDIFVLNGVAHYERKVTDVNGVEHTLVPNTEIKLVLRHNPNARTI